MVGVANITINDRTAHINSLEIVYRYRGMKYGTTFIEEFVKKYDIKKIVGVTPYSIVNFWFGLGAEIYIPCDDCSDFGTCRCQYKNGDICNKYTGEFNITIKNDKEN